MGQLIMENGDKIKDMEKEFKRDQMQVLMMGIFSII